ncbi:ArnT family glycosyltransferase [Chlamydiota bacterium]
MNTGNKIVLLIFLSAFILRVGYIFCGLPLVSSELHLVFDQDSYMKIAQTILSGTYCDILRGPLYPFMIAFLMLLKGSTLLYLRLTHIFFDSLTACSLFFIGRKVFSHRIGILAGFLYVVYPLALWRIAFVSKEIVFTFLLLLVVLFLIRSIESKQNRHFFMTGLILGIANLCRPILLVFPCVFGIVYFIKNTEVFFKKKCLHVFLLIMGMCLVIFPWTYRNYALYEQVIPVATERGGLAIFIGNFYPTRGGWEGPKKQLWEEAVITIDLENQGKTLVERDRVYYKKAIEAIVKNPVQFGEMVMYKFFRFWFISASGRMITLLIPLQLFLLMCAMIGFFAKKKTGQYFWILLSMLGYYMMIFLVTYSCVRFSLPIMPLVLVFSAAGIDSIVNSKFKIEKLKIKKM